MSKPLEVILEYKGDPSQHTVFRHEWSDVLAFVVPFVEAHGFDGLRIWVNGQLSTFTIEADLLNEGWLSTDYSKGKN